MPTCCRATGFRIWDAPGPLAAIDGNPERRRRAALIREAFLASLNADIVHVTSPYEGFADDAVLGIGALGKAFATSLTIPGAPPLPDAEGLPNLGRADLLLAVSSSRPTMPPASRASARPYRQGLGRP